jgi:PAS domain S-box-containing protein
MTGVSLGVGAIAMWLLYHTAIEQERDRLMETAQSQARLIEAVARFDAVESGDFPQGSTAATISQIVDAHKNYEWAGRTGEFALGRREGDQIVFLLAHRHERLGRASPVPWDSKLAEPMRQALLGNSGTIIAQDYRGETVLAAHEPVKELNLGIVAKIDLAEVRAPFVWTGLWSFIAAVLLVLFASLLFLRVSSPMVTRIEEQHARLNAILDTAADGVITINAQGDIESFNPAAERMFGWRKEEVVGKNVSLLMPQPEKDEHDRYLVDYLRTGRKKIIGVGREVSGLRKDGSQFPMDLAVSEVRRRDRRFFTGMVRDITERKRAEQDRRLAAVGQMLSAIAHESRNSLQRIQACLEMLRLDFEDNPEAARQLDGIERASDNLTRLFEELREFAAPLNLQREACDLGEIWRIAWANLAHMRRDRQAELRESGHGTDLRLEADGFRLEQVFRNMMENSLAACQDPVEIDIVCSEELHQGAPSVCIHIRDNGPGLSEEQKRRLFDAFYTTKAKGTGLGMAISRRIVEAHGGRIAVGEDCTRGAEFRLVLPRMKPAP